MKNSMLGLQNRPDTNFQIIFVHTVELRYKDLGLCDTSVITLYVLWYQFISHKTRVFLPCLVRHT